MALVLAEEDGAVCGTIDCREGARFSALWYRAVLAPLLMASQDRVREGAKERAGLPVLHRGDLCEETTLSSRGVSKKWPRH